MSRWEPLRMAGASARHMLREAAAEAWQVPVAEITTEAGVLYHKAGGKSAGYGEIASAAAKIPVDTCTYGRTSRTSSSINSIDRFHVDNLHNSPPHICARTTKNA